MSQAGPDRIIPCEDLVTWNRDGAIKLRIEEDSNFNPEPVSIPTFLKENCTKGGYHTAVAVKRGGVWVKWNYNAYYRDIRKTAKAFIKLGLERFHSVAIYGFNAPEWSMSSLGAVMAGGFSAGLYPTNSAEMNKFIMNDSKANILVCEDNAAVSKMWPIVNEVGSLMKIVQYTGEPEKPGVITWKELMEIAEDVDDQVLEERLSQMAINQGAVLIYTSGTTGNPKGVMLSHDTVVYNVKVAITETGWKEHDVIVSYLPLSHIAGLMVDVYATISVQGATYFADKTALKGSLLDYLKDVRPTRFLGVPRVWEKIMEGMLDKGKSIKGLKKKISVACKEAGLKHHLEKKDTVMFKVGQKVIYKKVKEALGLDKCEGFFSGAAPLSQDAMKYFLSLDIVISEIYGMSETGGPHTFGSSDNIKLGSCGKTMLGCKTRLSEPNADGEGEICMWGRNIMMGYLEREDKTTEEIDPEGWLHSGDLGTLDSDGYVYITGRKKELLITAGGENVAPVPVEDIIKKELPIVSNSILIGDKKKFLSVFLTLKTVIDPATEMPTPKLTPSAIEWCESLGRPNLKTVDDILRGPDPVIMSAIQAGIDRTNKQAVSNAARVQKWTILPLDVSIPGGELGPTMKLKRFAFNKKYADALERFYA